MRLSTSDLARLGAANQLLLSPLAAPDPQAWLLAAGAAIRDVVGGTGVVVQIGSESFPFASPDATDVVESLQMMVDAVQADGVRFSDPVTDLWNRLRRERGLRTFSWDANRHLVEAHGVQLRQGLLIDALRRQGYHDFVGMVDRAPDGEAMVWVLQRRHGAFPHAERTDALLGVLLPAFRAGLDTVARLGAHRAALDAVDAPLLALGPDGRERHRTPALARLLADPVEAEALAPALARLGRRALSLQGPESARAAGGEEAVTTARGRYTLRATALPPGLFGAEPALLVTVEPPPAPSLPTPESVRERHGLTPREAEVAVLLAQGCSNADLADRLFVSPHTARHHVENVLAKLEVAGRSGVAARLLAR
ncbi:LuxR C-terminal-related transcriptional regulator [Rubrivirga sp. IMCC43871]|uniref:helix-turn-helix transcriptional regulator n=1 Tax=Rubrivirga sp. IMCC43871 TaxID=3391575 RepID=UPI00398FC757